MKKIIIILCIFSVSLNQLSAQEFRFGLTASPVFSWLKIDGESFSNDGSRVGFQYGLLFDQTIGDVERYAFSSGFIINLTGGAYSYPDLTAVDTTTITTEESLIARVQYIEIPLTIKLRTNEINYLTYYGMFGVTPGFNIKARGEYTSTPDPLLLSNTDLNLREDGNPDELKYNLINMSLTLGAGLEYAMTENTAIVAGIFFQNGFSNVIQDKFDDNAMRLKQIGIRLGVLF